MTDDRALGATMTASIMDAIMVKRAGSKAAVINPTASRAALLACLAAVIAVGPNAARSEAIDAECDDLTKILKSQVKHLREQMDGEGFISKLRYSETVTQ